jgi:hypothetical protein
MARSLSFLCIPMISHFHKICSFVKHGRPAFGECQDFWQIVSIQLTPPDKYGMQKLQMNTTWGGVFLADIAPDQGGAAQKLIAAVDQAVHTP